MEWFAFKAGDEYLGIEAQYIHRVVDEIKITPVPLLPPCHRGLMYYRGEVFDVIDIGGLLGKSKAAGPPASQASPPAKQSEAARARALRAGNENSRIILLKWSHKKLALAPDKIIGLIWVEDNKGKETVYTPRPHRLSPPATAPPASRCEALRAGGGQEGEYTIRLITPEHILKKVSELSYGPYKV